MPGIDLSTLTAPELRQLLRLARGRHDGLLVDRVEWEIAQRKALESRTGVEFSRQAAALIEDSGVTIDEARAFRRPELELPDGRADRSRVGGGGRITALLGGLVAGSALTAGAFAGVDSGWRLPAAIEIPALRTATLADRAPTPAPVARPKPAVAAAHGSDAVAGVLAPEPFPPPVEVAEAPPPVEAAAVEAPAPTPEPDAVAEATPPPPPPAKAIEKKEPPPKAAPKKIAEKKKKDAAGRLAKTKAEPKSKTKLAAKAESDATPKPRDAKARLAAKDAPKSKVAKAEPKPVKPSKVRPQVAVAPADDAHDAIGALLAKSEALSGSR